MLAVCVMREFPQPPLPTNRASRSGRHLGHCASKSSGLFFLSDTLTEDAELSGTFSGELKASINKRDMDIGVVLYEVLPDGGH